MFEEWLAEVVFPQSEDHQHLVSVGKADNGLRAVFVLWFGCFEFCGKKRLLDHILKESYIMFPNFSASPIWLSCTKSQKGSNSDRKKKFLDNKEASDSLASFSLPWLLLKLEYVMYWAACEGTRLHLAPLIERVAATGYSEVQSYHKSEQQ